MEVIQERLAFTLGSGAVPRHGYRGAPVAETPTFATSAYAEPRDWGYIGLLAFTAVLMLRPQEQFHGLEPLHLAEICAVIGIGPMVLHRFAQRVPVFRITFETIGLVCFGAAILATAPFSIWPGGAFDVFFDSYLKIVMVFILMMNTLTTPKRVDRLAWLIVLCCGYIAGRAVFDYARGVNLVEGGRVGGAEGGIFGNPNDLALNMVSFLPLAIVVALSGRHSAVRRIGAAAIAGLMLATVVFTKSRGGALGLGVMFAALLFLGRRIRPSFAVLALAAILVAVPFAPASFWDRMATITNEEQDKTEFTGSAEARRVVMEEGVGAFFEHPFTGVGAGQFRNYNPPGRRERWRETHNAVIQVAADTGIFGLIAFLFLMGRGFLVTLRTRRMLARRRKRGAVDPLTRTMTADDRHTVYELVTALSAGAIGWFVCSLFASVAYSWTFYYLLALIVATSEIVRVRIAAGQAKPERLVGAA